MQTKLIQTKDYLLLIDEEAEIISQEGQYLDKDYNIFSLIFYPEKVIGKIIAYYPLTEEAKELDLPLLPNPFKEDIDVERLAEMQVEKEGWGKYDGTSEQYGIKNSYIEGYKAAQQSNKRFSLEDIEQVIKLTLEDAKKICNMVRRILQASI